MYISDFNYQRETLRRLARIIMEHNSDNHIAVNLANTVCEFLVLLEDEEMKSATRSMDRQKFLEDEIGRQSIEISENRSALRAAQIQINELKHSWATGCQQGE